MRLVTPPRCDLCRQRPLLAVIVALLSFTVASSALAAAAARLKVALVSGSDLPVYTTDQSLPKLKQFLEANYPMECVIVWQEPADGGFKNIEALATADLGVFFVRRKTPPPKTLAVIQDFFRSGKGVVAIGPTSHGWENWPAFDREVLGAKYDGSWEGGRKPTDTRLRPHWIFTGAEDYTTFQYVYNYTQIAPDVRVLMEAGLEGKTMPIAWTRETDGRRLFYLAPCVKDEFEKPAYLRIIANGLLWTAKREIPGAAVRVLRTWMPDAHPASFAVGFPDGMNFCFDPERGQLAYAWEGDFLDLEPTYTGKFPRDAKIIGATFHRATHGSFGGSNPTAKTDIRFKGYQVKNGVPEFSYEVDGVAVRESIRPTADHRGLIRQFQVEGTDRVLAYRPANPGQVTIQAGPARWTDGRLNIPANASVQFSETILKP